MKILLLSDEFPPEGMGGDSTVVANLARGYMEDGHEVFVLTSTQKSNRAGPETWQGIQVQRIFSKFYPRWWAWTALWRPRVIQEVREVLYKFRPEVVHTHGVHSYLSYYSLRLANKSGARVYLTAHDSMLYALGKSYDESYVSEWNLIRRMRLRYNPLHRVLVRRMLRKNVDGIIAVSDSIAKALSKNGIKVLATVHNGVDVDAWGTNERGVSNFKKKYGLGQDMILFGGRLSGAKGAFVAVEALKKVLAKVPDAQLCVIGTKNDVAEKMLALARSMGIEKNIVFTGRISGEELRAAYHAAAVVTLPSIYLEPFGLVALEAMAASKPVVATSLGGPSEIVKEGGTGFTVNPNDREAFAEKLALILLNADLRQKMGYAGFERVKQNFSIKKQVREYEKIFLAND